MADEYSADAPPYASFFGVMGVTSAMAFCGKIVPFVFRNLSITLNM